MAGHEFCAATPFLLKVGGWLRFCDAPATPKTADVKDRSRADRMLRYASSGHPPAILIDPSRQAMELDAEGLPVGLFPETKYEPAAVRVPAGSRVYLFPDGCYEIQRSDGEEWTREAMINYLNTLPPDEQQLDALYRKSMITQGGERLEDDFSILCATFTWSRNGEATVESGDGPEK